MIHVPLIRSRWDSRNVAMRAGENGNTGKVQFQEIPGPAYVSADVPGRGIRPRNAFTLKNGIGAIPNIGPIPGATAYGAAPCPRTSGCMRCLTIEPAVRTTLAGLAAQT